MSNDLPKGWTTANLAELVGFVLGGDWGRGSHEDTEGLARVRVIRGTEFKNWREDRGVSAAERYIKLSSLEKRRLQEGDLVLEVSGGGPSQPVGRTVLIDLAALQRSDAPLVCSNFFRLIRLRRCINPRFVSRFLGYAYSLGIFDQFQTQTTNLRNLNVNDFLREINVAIAPLAEQKRIVAKLEALLAKVDSCQDRLAKMPTILERFRKSVLAAACSGHITADWRAQHPYVDHALALIKSDQFELREPESGLGELPAKWNWVALGNYGQCSRGRFSVRPRNDPNYFVGDHPFIQIGDLPSAGGWIRTHRQTLNDRGLSVSKKFPKGTVVVAIVGATIGNTGLLGYEMCFTDSLVGIETGTEVGNRYIELYLRNKKYEIRYASYSSGGQPNIKLDFLNPYPLALPPLAEQQEIVRRVEALFALADQIESRFGSARKQIEKLTSSLLGKAFRGELVYTEAELAEREGRSFESAAELLARLKLNSVSGDGFGQERASGKRSAQLRL
jgi:type I restriction enzyme S subunit